MTSISPRILYVDDDEDSCEMICLMLQLADANYDTVTARSTKKALCFIAEQPFDMYIFDYKLPDMTGVELCRLIRKTDSKTPILIFSGMARDIDREDAKVAGADCYLVKPNDLNVFTSTVKSLLNRNAAAFDQASSFGNAESI